MSRDEIYEEYKKVTTKLVKVIVDRMNGIIQDKKVREKFEFSG